MTEKRVVMLQSFPEPSASTRFSIYFFVILRPNVFYEAVRNRRNKQRSNLKQSSHSEHSEGVRGSPLFFYLFRLSLREWFLNGVILLLAGNIKDVKI